MFNNKVITIFGGTGTIGSFIVEYILKNYKPEAIRIFTNDEHSLVKSRKKWDYSCMRFLLGDIRDPKRCSLAVRNADYVFNCAAIKHVPEAEYNPIEAVKVNILGLENIIDACIERNIIKFLQISTDKAVEPTTIMGMTKKIGEELVQRRWYQNPNINMVCVRLGNVYGSRGSIVPFIHKCIKEKTPIGITDEEMERFFMSPEETINFIMLAFKKGKDGEIWVPKLKEIKLMDLVKKEAGETYPIEIIGIRKGEKLKEKMLAYDETLFADHTHRNYWIIPARYKQ